MPRFRDLGLTIGALPAGPANAITDVDGVRVGHATLVEGDGPLRIGEGPVRTGVTAVLPHGGDMYTSPVEAGQHTFNGAGTTAGLYLIDEFGRIEEAILNSMFQAHTVVGRDGNTREALDLDRVLEILAAHGVAPSF